jgi:hypothetical protein
LTKSCVVLCLAAVFAGTASAAELRDAKFGYSVTPPEFPGPRAGDVFTRLNVLAVPDAGFASNMGVMVQEVAITRDQFVSQTKAQFVDAGMKLRSSSNRTVSGRPAVVFDYEGPVRERPLRFLQLAVFLPERVLLLTYTAPAATFGRYEAEFKRSLETFKLGK